VSAFGIFGWMSQVQLPALSVDPDKDVDWGVSTAFSVVTIEPGRCAFRSRRRLQLIALNLVSV